MSLSLVETITATGSESTLEFTNIPQSGLQLILKVSARGGTRYNSLTVNNSSGTNYLGQRLGNENNSTYSSSQTAAFYRLMTTGSTDTSNAFGGGDIVISNYATTSDTIMIYSVTHANNNDLDDLVENRVARYTGGGPIESVQVICASGNWAANSSVSLYIVS